MVELYSPNNTSSIQNTIAILWEELLESDWNTMSYGASAYDTAWVSLIKEESYLFPRAYQWLLDNQHADGSWGSDTFYFHDRILCTLVAAISMADHGNMKQLKPALRWIRKYLPRIKQYSHEIPGIGFAIIFPSLLDYLGKNLLKLGIDMLSEPMIQKLIGLWTVKVGELDIRKVLSKPSQLAWNLEFLSSIQLADPSINLEELNLDQQLQKRPDGYSVIESTGTTAWYYMQNISSKQDELLSYLRSMEREDGSFAQYSPLNTFNLLWSLEPLVNVIKYIPEQFHKEILKQFTRFRKDGICMGEYFIFTDSDDSIAMLHALELGDLLRPSDRHKFKYIDYYDVDGRWFESYVGRHGKTSSRNLTGKSKERHTHSVNLRILHGYNQSKLAPNRDYVVEKLLNSFKQYLEDNPYFGADRWVMEPSYNNYLAVVTFAEIRPQWARQCLNWFDEHQNADGLWGEGKSQYEVTARAFLAYSHYHLHVSPLDMDWEGIINYLVENYDPSQESQSAIWNCKTLYKAEYIKSYTLACLLSYAKIRGIPYEYILIDGVESRTHIRSDIINTSL